MHGLAFFTKRRPLQPGVRTVQKILNKLTLIAKIERYPAMLVMVICFNERNLLAYLKLYKTPMIDLLQEYGKLKYDRLASLKKLTYFKTHCLKMIEFYNGMMEGSKMEWLFGFKI